MWSAISARFRRLRPGRDGDRSGSCVVRWAARWMISPAVLDSVKGRRYPSAGAPGALAWLIGSHAPRRSETVPVAPRHIRRPPGRSTPNEGPRSHAGGDDPPHLCVFSPHPQLARRWAGERRQRSETRGVLKFLNLREALCAHSCFQFLEPVGVSSRHDVPGGVPEDEKAGQLFLVDPTVHASGASLDRVVRTLTVAAAPIAGSCRCRCTSRRRRLGRSPPSCGRGGSIGHPPRLW